DVVHLATEGPLGLSALRAARRRGLAITSSFHTNFDSYSGFYGFPGASRSVAAYLRWFHNRTDRTLVPNPDLARRLEDIGHRAIETVGRGVDAALFDPARRSDALRRRWGVADDALAIGYFGRVAPEKNMATAMRAIDAACAAAPGAVGVMIGDGPLGERLRRRHPTVAHCGMRTGVDLAAHVASLDVVVLPSRTETFGNVVLEAMASGTAIVAFDAAAVRLHVRDDVDGRTVAMPARRDGAAGGRAADDAFVAAATALVRDPAAIARIRRAARATACRLSWTRIVDRFAQILVSASQMRPAPASDHASRAVARRDLRLLQ
ncbi:MAG: glycosyltransferase, partial [Acidobacteriota bacterium]